VGLCNAYSNGGLNSTSTAYAALAEAAGGESGIVSYCATVSAPEDEADGTGETPEGDAVEEPVEQQQVKEQPAKGQRQGPAAGSNGAGQQSNNAARNSAAHPGGGQR
jgi:hypothetical protein